MPAQRVLEQKLSSEHNTLIHVVSGELKISGQPQGVRKKSIAILSGGTRLEVNSNSATQFLLISANRLNEPVARSGPFVMNTQDEIRQAYADFYTK